MRKEGKEREIGGEFWVVEGEFPGGWGHAPEEKKDFFMFFSNRFKFKNEKETVLESEYLLLHEILSILYSSGFSTTRVGSIKGGYEPIYEHGIESSYLIFGVLGAIINKAEIAQPKPDSNFLFLRTLTVKEEDVPITKCTWQQLSKAVDTLEAAKEVKKVLANQASADYNVKSVHLTPEGLYSLNTRKYETLYNSEKDKRQLQISTLITQRLTRLFTGIVTTSTVVTLCLTIFDKCYKDNKPTVVIMQAPITTSTPSSPIHTYKNSPEKKDVADSILHKK